jgi:DNA repair exonuclease SbcCD ATPase subunit
MYISQLIVKNLGCFKGNFTVEFNPGMNLIIDVM